MNSDAVRTLWVAVLAGVFAMAAISSLLGVFWHQDVLYLLNLGVLVWTAVRTRAPGPSRRRSAAMILNLFALTIYAGRTAAEGVGLSVQDWLRLQDGWISPALLGANYLAHVAVAIVAYRARPRERRHPILRLLAAGAVVPVLFVLWLSLAQDDPVAFVVERRVVSPILVYEKWVVDIGGTGGDDCRVYRIRTLGLVARYQQIDPDHGDPSPISGGCGL